MVIDDVCALLAVPLGRGSSVYSLSARRAASFFAAMAWYRCGRPFDESLSAASSRTRSTECGFAKAKLEQKQAIAAARPGTRAELSRACDESSFVILFVSREAIAYGYLEKRSFHFRAPKQGLTALSRSFLEPHRCLL